MAPLSPIASAAQHLIRDQGGDLPGVSSYPLVADTKPAYNDLDFSGSRTSGVPPDPRAFFGARDRAHPNECCAPMLADF